VALKRNYSILTAQTAQPGARSETALALVDKDGIESLSMRNLAAKLSVEAMSQACGDKDAVLDGLVELILREINSTGRYTPWRERCGAARGR
jgi:hypothetical protein